MNPNDSDKTLKNLIEAAGTTQRDLSKKISAAEVTVNSWAAGKKMPRFDNALVLARELGVSLKTLAKAIGLDVTGIPDDEPPT